MTDSTFAMGLYRVILNVINHCLVLKETQKAEDPERINADTGLPVKRICDQSSNVCK